MTPTRNGTMREVAEFFRVSVRTLVRWNQEKPPRIGHIRDGLMVVYPGEAIARYYARHFVADRRATQEDALEEGRQAWSAFCEGGHDEGKLADLEGRVSRIEAALKGALEFSEEAA